MIEMRAVAFGSATGRLGGVAVASQRHSCFTGVDVPLSVLMSLFIRYLILKGSCRPRTLQDSHL